MPKLLDADHTVLAPEAEAAQPLYARYWLHNRGPAPLGGLPAVAHLHPQHVVGESNAQVLLRLTAASDCTDAALHGKVRLLCPAGWTADPAELSFVLPPGEYLEADIAVTSPPDTPAGLYPVRAEIAVTGSGAAWMPAAWRQVVEDVCIVSVGEPSGGVLRLVSEPEAVDVNAGESARLAVTVATDARADLAVEAHLISPWGTWEWMGPAALGAELPAAGTVELGFDVHPPAWVEPGEWWALIRVGCAGRLLYSPAVKVVVR
jgi:alpha-mannosidase